MKRAAYAIAVLGFSLLGCGTDKGEGQAQPGSTITISPPSITWDADVLVPAQDLTQLYTITVLGPSGNPQRNAAVQVFLDLSAGTTTDPAPTLELVDSRGITRISPFVDRTDDFGNLQVSVIFPIGGGASFIGNLQAFSGSASARSTITVTCSDANTTDATTC